MNPIDMVQVRQFIEDNIDSFHAKRLEFLEEVKLKNILKRKNPYLFKAKHFDTVGKIVEALLDASLSSSEETIFGYFLESLAIFINGMVYEGRKSSTEGIDLEFDKDGVRYIVSIKSGPNWGNSSQIKKMKDNFRQVKRILQGQAVTAVNGCCYGIDAQPEKEEYHKYCGQRFWRFISGSDSFYTDIIEPFAHKAKQKNEDFNAERGRIINRFTVEFAKDFCNADGEILWEELAQLNSQDLTIDHFTTKEAAEKLNISTATVLKRVKKGMLKAIKRGNKWYIHESLSVEDDTESPELPLLDKSQSD